MSLRTNWCDYHCSDIWYFVFRKIAVTVGRTWSLHMTAKCH